MNIIDVAQTRYATKKFDSNKRISVDVFDQVKKLLQLSPSSINAQPWHFMIAQSEQGKAKMALAAHGAYQANEAKIKDASHVILFCAKTEISDDYLLHITEQEAADGRFAKPEAKELVLKVRHFYTDLHRKEWLDVKHWAENQVYLNIGNFLLGVGALGLDAVPIEGVDLAVLNKEFELTEKGLKAVAVVAVGYQADDDMNAKLPKSRLPESEIMTMI